MRILISAGEASGDAYGAALVDEMRRLSTGLDFSLQSLRSMLGISPEVPGTTRLSALARGDIHTEPSERIFRMADIYGFDLAEVAHPAELTVDEAVALFAAEQRVASKLKFEGAGGAKMRAAGVEVFADSSTWGVISIAQVLSKLPRLVGGFRILKQAIATGVPGLFIPIDFGYMNIRLAQHAKRFGWKVLYFVPPGSWRRDKQGRDLPVVTDAISTPFSWSAEILNRMGARAHWFGHPIKQLLPKPESYDERVTGRLAILPGSREHEIAENLPLIATVLQSLAGIGSVEFALAPSVDEKRFADSWSRLSGRAGDSFTKDAAGAVLRRAEIAIVCSGTATLEAALCRCPMVVVYRLSKTMQAEVKLLRIKRPQYVALPNILLDRPVVPELIQNDATPEKVTEALQDLLTKGRSHSEQLSAFAELDRELGPGDAITKTAELAIQMLGNPR